MANIRHYLFSCFQCFGNIRLSGIHRDKKSNFTNGTLKLSHKISLENLASFTMSAYLNYIPVKERHAKPFLDFV